MKVINSDTLKRMIISGTNNLYNHYPEIDALNVFPVPDGDTGTNMNLTIASGAKEVQNRNDSDVYSIAKAFSKGLLMGARGNSGVILSQIFRGFSQSLEGKDVITDPKTPKSNRTIVMPDFLAVEMENFISSLYGIRDDDRIFTISKSYLHHEMDRGAKLAGVKRIRIHGLRHSHISLLINLGFSALAIGERDGQEAVDITYHYAYLFPTVQTDMAAQLETEREALVNVRKE